jgi:N-acetylmuramoyl-L-alanine amidase
MKLLIYSFIYLFFSFAIKSQTIVDLKNRFNTYLNFKESLNHLVSFHQNAVSISNMGKAEFTVYENEINCLSLVFTNFKTTELINFYNWKKNRILTTKQIDSLFNRVGSTRKNVSPSLKGKRIAIDAGHFAGNMEVAKIEQKFIEFKPSPENKLRDTIRFNEGFLTFQTAELLKHQLEEQGAVVFMTRPRQNYTSFQITYNDWILRKKKRTLDSLLKTGNISYQRHATLMKLSAQKLFWEFFRDFELMERARIINEFKPDVSIIIHYNVDEKNADWKSPTSKNYTMAFIAGGITADNFSKTINKIHFLRLLISNQINESERLSSLTVNQFNKLMNIKVAKKNDADYLRENCLNTPSVGVFCRNLALCRHINSTLVYGECLYQDNESECVKLSTNDYELNNQKIPKRIYEAAMSYYHAVNEFFSK